jgi:preprotein translocase subunit SecG
MILDIVQLASAIALIIAIILQNRGTGLGSAFGGEGNVYRAKRGMEKTLFRLTIVLAIIFFVTAIVNIIY